MSLIPEFYPESPSAGGTFQMPCVHLYGPHRRASFTLSTDEAPLSLVGPVLLFRHSVIWALFPSNLGGDFRVGCGDGLHPDAVAPWPAFASRLGKD